MWGFWRISLTFLAFLLLELGPGQHGGAAAASVVRRTPPQDLLRLPTYVLSLTHATTRRANMVERLEEVEADFTLVEAINASQQIAGGQVVGVWEAPNPQARGLEGLLQPDPLPFNFTVPYNCLSTSRAHLACSFAHVLISLSAYLAGHEVVLVLEDDMQILRWPTRGTLHSAPPDWEVLQLYMLGRAADLLYTDPPSLWVPWRPGIFNTGAYLINRAGMRKIITTYLPEALPEEALLPPELTHLNASTIIASECVADYVVYNPTRSYASTDFYFVEEALDSGIKPEQLFLHQATRELVMSLVQQRGFAQDLRLGR